MCSRFNFGGDSVHHKRFQVSDNTYSLIFFSFVFILPFFDSFNKVIFSLFQNELLFKILTGYFYDVLMGRILN